MMVVLEEIPEERAQILANLMELCQHDYTQFDPHPVNEDGRFGYRYLPHYWREPDRCPLLIRADGEIAGFVLVNTYTVLGKPGDRSIAEFFVMRAYRKRGVGSAAAQLAFDRFPGRWEVRQTAANEPAQRFWRRVISDYTGGEFTEQWTEDDTWHGPVQSFEAVGR